jgi:hypothetical protein
MSVGAVSGPDPAFYSYPSTLPPSLTAAASSSSASAVSSATSSAAATPLSSYQAEFDTLQQDDAAELLQVSLGSTANAQSNVASVLAQAAALQSQQLAAQQQQDAASAQAAVQSSTGSTTDSSTSTSSSSDPLTLPTLQSLFDQSDSDASANLSNYQSSGSSIDLLA